MQEELRQQRVTLKCHYVPKATGHVSGNWATICAHHEKELPGIRDFTEGTFNLKLDEPKTYVPPGDHDFKEAAKKRGQSGGNHISPRAKVVELNGKAVDAWLYRGGHPDSVIELLSKLRLADFPGIVGDAVVTVVVAEYASATDRDVDIGTT